MPVTLDPTPGGAAANTYATQAEADAYFAARQPLSPAWEDADDPTVMLATAARVLDNMYMGRRRLVREKGYSYYSIDQSWAGAKATAAQRRQWPRSGVLYPDGTPVGAAEIPVEIKEAQIELAGALLKGDRTLDNDVIVQGLTSLRAGSVSLGFKENFAPQVIPDAVLNAIPPSFLNDAAIEPALAAQFDVVSD